MPTPTQNNNYQKDLQSRVPTVNSPADNTPSPSQDVIPQNNITTPPVDTTSVPMSQPTTPQPVNNGNLYNMSRGDLQNKISDTSNQLINYTNSFNKGDIAEKMRLKTGGVKDLDSKIAKLTTSLNTSLSEGMAKYSDIIDFRKRNQLVQEDQKNIRNQISDLSAVRKYRLGTIQDMANAEISRGEQRLRGLQSQLDLYNNVMGDMDKADKTQTQMDSLALKLDKQRQDLAINNERYGLTKEPGSTSYGKTDLTNLQDTYKNSASFKNNNPGNIKFTDTFANTLSKYGINVTKGSGATDGGNFAKFNSIEDALQGRQILLFKTATYPNMTVDDAMKRYSNSGYGAEVSNVDGNKLMKDLSTSERSSLIMGQLQREDPNMYKELLKQGIDPSKVITKPSYKKTGLSSVEKKAQEKGTTSLNFAKYVSKEKNNIVEGLKGDKLDNVIPTLSTLYPTQNNPLKSIGRTLNKTDKADIMSNIIKQAGLTGDSKVSEINDMVEKYASLFYPNKTLSNIEHTLGQDFLDSMNIGSTEGFLDARQNLREKYNDQFN